MTFEKKLAKLEKIVEKVEDAQTPLEKSIALYKEGLALAKECTEALNTIEEEIQVLQQCSK